MLKLEMLSAGHGDCLWIEYGDPAKPQRILIDGGATGTYKRALRPKLLALPEAQRHFELLIITHIDADHIKGVLELLQDADIGFQAKDIWFNGYRHLPDEAPDTIGAVQGEKLTDAAGQAWRHRGTPRSSRRAVVVPADGPLPRVALPGGLVLTLLSPTAAKLAELKPKWEDAVRKAGLDPTVEIPQEVVTPEGFELLGIPDVDALAGQPFVEDAAEANGSSVAVLAEFEGHSLLLTGDAHPGVLAAAIKRIEPGASTPTASCRSMRSSCPIMRARPMSAASCSVRSPAGSTSCSTNGAHFGHPDLQAVARVIKWGGAQATLMFNYRTRFNDAWDSALLRQRHGYTATYPATESEGIALEWR